MWDWADTAAPEPAVTASLNLLEHVEILILTHTDIYIQWGKGILKVINFYDFIMFKLMNIWRRE